MGKFDESPEQRGYQTGFLKGQSDLCTMILSGLLADWPEPLASEPAAYQRPDSTDQRE